MTTTKAVYQKRICAIWCKYIHTYCGLFSVTLLRVSNARILRNQFHVINWIIIFPSNPRKLFSRREINLFNNLLCVHISPLVVCHLLPSLFFSYIIQLRIGCRSFVCCYCYWVRDIIKSHIAHMYVNKSIEFNKDIYCEIE